MENITLSKKLADNGVRDLPLISVELSIMDLISIYNACADIVNEHPQMIGYKNICLKLSKEINKVNK